MSTPIDTPPSLGSLVDNQLCGVDRYGNGTYTTEGITKLCKGLKGSAVTSLECAAPECSLFVSAPVDTAVFTASRLSSNSIGGYYNKDDEFVANTEGIIALCEGLKGSAVTSLECAATLQVFAFLSAPIDTPTLSPFPSCPSLAVLAATTLEPWAPPRSPPSSRRRRSPPWGKPPP